MPTGDDHFESNPNEIYDLLIGHWKTGVIKAAITLDVFSRIAAGENTVEALALACSVKERGIRVLLDSLCGLGLLNKETGVYVLSRAADQFLVKGKTSYIGSAAMAFANMDDWEAMGRIDEAIMKGGPLKEEPDPQFWADVAMGLVPLGAYAGQLMCDILDIRPDTREGFRVLDIACGSGVYGFSILQRDHAATVTDYDLEDVLGVSAEVARDMGVGDRVIFNPGNIENPDFGENAFDLVIISHILQGYDPAMIEVIIGEIYRALVPGGRVVIHEFVPDEERVSKCLPLLFAAYMFAVTPGGGTYTFSEFSQWLTAVGFRSTKIHDLPTQTSIIVAQK
jgi:C-methyltransferase